MSLPDHVVSRTFSYANGLKFDFPVTRRELEATPRWEAGTPNPPLSVRDALALAEDFLPRLVPEADRWRLRGVTLHPFGNDFWVYRVEFHGFHPPHVHDGAVPILGLTVLMDGTVVEPIITEHRLL